MTTPNPYEDRYQEELKRRLGAGTPPPATAPAQDAAAGVGLGTLAAAPSNPYEERYQQSLAGTRTRALPAGETPKAKKFVPFLKELGGLAYEQTGAKGMVEGLDWLQRNISEPIGAAATMVRFPGPGIPGIARRGGFEFDPEQLPGRSRWRETYRENVPLGGRVLTEAVTDPLNLVPGIGFTKISQLRRLGGRLGPRRTTQAGEVWHDILMRDEEGKVWSMSMPDTPEAKALVGDWEAEGTAVRLLPGSSAEARQAGIQRLRGPANSLASEQLTPMELGGVEATKEFLATREAQEAGLSQLERAELRLEEARGSLAEEQVRGVPAPKFGTSERVEFDAARERRRQAGKRVTTKAERVKEAKRRVAQAQDEVDRIVAEELAEEAQPAVAPVAKEPWQMTYRQYVDSLSQGVPGGEAAKHHRLIMQALKEGKPVPPEVLANYSDLAARMERSQAGEASTLKEESALRQLHWLKAHPDDPALSEIGNRFIKVLTPELEAPQLARASYFTAGDSRSVTRWLTEEGRRRLSTPEEAAQLGTIQTGMSIGEPPSQGTLGLAGQEGISRPLIDAEQVAERQRLAAERAAGQEGLIGTVPLIKGETALPERNVPLSEIQAPLASPPAAARPLAIAPQGPPAGGQLPPSAGVPPGGVAPPPSSQPVPSTPSGAREIDRIIVQSKEVVRQDRPGTISGLLQKIPGVGSARVFERPGLKMIGENERVLIGHVAETAAKSDVTSRAMSSRAAIGKQLEDAFGREAMKGAKIDVPFIGTTEEAAHLITGRLKDIADNPQLYRLTPEQTAALVALDERNTALLSHVTEGYGAEIGKYPAKPGGAYLPNVEVVQDVADTVLSDSRAVARGRGKPRFYPSARERMTADPTFSPLLDVNKLIDGLDRSKANAAAGNTFRDAVGGLTKAEVMEKTHPGLFKRMTALRARLTSFQGSARRLNTKLATAVDDFLASPLEDNDLADLRDALDVKLASGKRAGLDRTAIQADINKIKADIAGLRPAWKVANLKPYEFVEEGIYRYFPAEQANLVKGLRKVSNNPVLKFLESWRGGAFSGDLSPLLGVQTLLGALFEPLGQFKMGAGAVNKAVQERNILRSFSTKALAEDIGKNQESWSQFFSLMGRAPTGTPSEFAGGYLSKLPGFSRFTEGTFIAVTRQAHGMWERMARELIKDGVPELVAQVAAAGKVSEVFPLLSPTRLGQSPARQALLRALPTSYSFIRQPAALIAEAARGYAKLGLKQTLTPAESLAVKLITTLAGTVAAVSVSSAVISAKARGEDVKKAVLGAINPDPRNGRFASVILGSVRVPIGGPYRAIFRAIYPKEVSGVPVPVPFAGMPQYLHNRLNPAASTQLRLYKNKDFYNRAIRTGDFPSQLMDSVRYEMEGAAPLSVGTVLEAQRNRASPQEIAVQAAGQFAGTNVAPSTTIREQVGAFEKAGEFPEKGTSLPVLKTAYYQAGEGFLSPEGRSAWRRYEPLPSRERKILIRTFAPSIREEVRRVEAYRPRRRMQLARGFPDLDVLLVEEAWNSRLQRGYTPKTQEGKRRLAELRREKFGTGIPIPQQTPFRPFTPLEPPVSVPSGVPGGPGLLGR